MLTLQLLTLIAAGLGQSPDSTSPHLPIYPRERFFTAKQLEGILGQTNAEMQLGEALSQFGATPESIKSLVDFAKAHGAGGAMQDAMKSAANSTGPSDGPTDNSLTTRHWMNEIMQNPAVRDLGERLSKNPELVNFIANNPGMREAFRDWDDWAKTIPGSNHTPVLPAFDAVRDAIRNENALNANGISNSNRKSAPRPSNQPGQYARRSDRPANSQPTLRPVPPRNQSTNSSKGDIRPADGQLPSSPYPSREPSTNSVSRSNLSNPADQIPGALDGGASGIGRPNGITGPGSTSTPSDTTRIKAGPLSGMVTANDALNFLRKLDRIGTPAKDVPELRSAIGRLEQSRARAASNSLRNVVPNAETLRNQASNVARQFEGAGKQAESFGRGIGRTIRNHLPNRPRFAQSNRSLPRINLPNVSVPRISPPNVSAPSFSSFGLPSFNLGSVPVAILMIAMAGLLAAMFLKQTPLPRALARQRLGAIKISNRAELREAFEKLALFVLGPAAAAWHHRKVAGAFAMKDASAADASKRFADLYERARYSPPEDALNSNDLHHAREDYRLLARKS